MRDAGIKPDIQGVGCLVIGTGFTAEQFASIQREPGFDTFLFDFFGDLFN